jgi:glycosyltransferase involved in cell wall biosynthesis
MLLENEPYPQDVRVRAEAKTLVDAGHAVRVLAPRAAGQARSELVDGVHVRRYALPQSSGGVAGFVGEYAVAHAQLLPRGLAALLAGADVVHLHNPPDTLFPVALAARGLGRAAVFDQHDLFPELTAMTLRSSLLERLAGAAQRAALRAATEVIVTNESQRELAIERGGLAPEGVTVVRNGPPRATLVGGGRDGGGTLDAPKLVYVGRLAPQDGVLDLPALMSEPALARASLTVVGGGPCQRPLESALAASANLAARIRLTGPVEHGRVPALLAEADIAIDPAPCTPFNERSTMVKIAEYLAAGLPVVAYDLLETRRTAGDAAFYARCGERADFARRVARVAGEPALRAELVERAVERAPSLVWERSAEALLGVYERLPRHMETKGAARVRS